MNIDLAVKLLIILGVVASMIVALSVVVIDAKRIEAEERKEKGIEVDNIEYR